MKIQSSVGLLRRIRVRHHAEGGLAELCGEPTTSEVSAQHELNLPGSSRADGTGIDGR
jgi:hypothetical protein